VNYMMAKDSVKRRLETGLSFTEFSYQLVQGYDYYWLFQNKNCRLQMGGSDQWGNIVTGTELIRRKAAGEAFALTSPLITKSDGSKFGKTEKGNVWLDPRKTSPYQFYQFWLNCADEDASRFIRIFTFIPREEIESLEQQHAAAPEQRILQKRLASDLTIRIHSEQDLKNSEEASRILFGQGTAELLRNIDERMLLDVMEGVPQVELSRSDLESGIPVLDLLTEKTGVMPSKGEARKMLASGGISLNKEKIADVAAIINTSQLIGGRYLLIQKGKKNYFLVKAG